MLTVEWFGLPDTEKRHAEQLEYGFKGRSNDTLRQVWMAKVVPFCIEVGLQVPAHQDVGHRVSCWTFRTGALRRWSRCKRWKIGGGPDWLGSSARWNALEGPMREDYDEEPPPRWQRRLEPPTWMTTTTRQPRRT